MQCTCCVKDVFVRQLVVVTRLGGDHKYRVGTPLRVCFASVESQNGRIKRLSSACCRAPHSIISGVLRLEFSGLR